MTVVHIHEKSISLRGATTPFMGFPSKKMFGGAYMPPPGTNRVKSPDFNENGTQVRSER